MSMKRRMNRLPLLTAALLLTNSVDRALAATPSASQTKDAPNGAAPPGNKLTFGLGLTAVLVVRLRPGWTDRSGYHAGTLKTIRLVREAAPGVPRAKVLLTPLVPVHEESQLVSPEQIRNAIEQRASAILSNAVEKDLKVEERSAGNTRLTYFSATDPKPKPGEYLRVTQGMAMFRDVPFSFTVLYDDPSVRDEMLATLGGWSLYGVADRATGDVPPNKAAVAGACSRGDGLACGLLAEFFRNEEDSSEAGAGRQHLEAGCKHGSAFACASLAAVYDRGDGVPRDEKKALSLSERACDAHSALACLNAAELLKKGPVSTATSTTQAIVDRFVDRACGFGGDREGACRMSDAASEARDAADYFRRQGVGCIGKSGRACRLLGWALETGYGTLVDDDAARDAYGRACAAGDVWGCFRQALLTSDMAEQARLYERACQQGSGPACYGLTLPPYGRTEPRRKEFLRRACESDIQEACVQVLAMLSR